MSVNLIEYLNQFVKSLSYDQAVILHCLTQEICNSKATAPSEPETTLDKLIAQFGSDGRKALVALDDQVGVAEQIPKAKEYSSLYPVVSAIGDSNFFTVYNGHGLVYNVDTEEGCITTAPLVPGKLIDLLTISNFAGRIGEIDQSASLDTILVTIGSELFRFRVGGSPYSNFVKSPSGTNADTVLDLKANLKWEATGLFDLWGNPSKLNALGDLMDTLSLQIGLKGGLNRERGVVCINPEFLTLTTSEPLLSPIVDQLNMSVDLVGYTLKTTFVH